MNLIEVSGLTKTFNVARGTAGKRTKIIAVNNVDFEIKEGETLGLVGESGCGKTTIGRLLVRLISASGGKIYFESDEITSLGDREFFKYRRNMQIVFQDPYSSLNPRMSIYDILKRPIRIFKLAESKEEERGLILKTLNGVGLKSEHMTRYPHEFSGGQRQRIAVARAIINNPKFVVLDEPTSALDVSVQAQLMNLLKDLKEKLKLTYLFISHDLSVVKFISDRIAVMYLGNFMEVAPTKQIFENTLHPYTQLLFKSIPVPNPRRKMEYSVNDGEIPSLLNPPKGCPFVTRCPERMDICEREKPRLKEVDRDHKVACFLY